MLFDIVIYLIAGGVAGIAAGLLGVGGGIVTVPFLAFILPYDGVPEKYVMHVAVTTSLMIVVGTSISSILAHHRKKGIRWDLFWQFLPGLAIGAIIAAFIADKIPGSFLRILFGIFAFLMACKMLLEKKNEASDLPELKLPGRIGMILSGAMISGLCNLLGLGGGSLMVPFLNHYQLPIRLSVGTSALCGFPIALVGVICLILLSENAQLNIPFSTGFVYWPAAIIMLVSSILTAPMGAHWAHSVSTVLLRKIFAIFLLVVGIDMLLKAVI